MHYSINHFHLFQDTEDYCGNPFLAQRVSTYFQNNEGDFTAEPSAKRKKDEKSMFCYIKMRKSGSKMIRVEVYDVKNENIPSDLVCKCNADICMQHVVESDNIAFDEIYNTTKNLITKIQKQIEKCNK